MFNKIIIFIIIISLLMIGIFFYQIISNKENKINNIEEVKREEVDIEKVREEVKNNSWSNLDFKYKWTWKVWWWDTF